MDTSGKLFAERMIPVRIACTSHQIELIADMTAKYYEQIAVMYYPVTSEVFIHHYDPDKGYARVKKKES